MQSQQQPPAPAAGAGTGTPRSARQTNTDANFLSHPLKRLSLHTPTRPHSPSLNSPRRPAEPGQTPSSPNLPPLSIRRSSSVVSLNRSQSPALARKSSSSSLRGDAPGSPRGAPSRRSSFNPNMPSPIGARSPLQPPPEEKLPLRACDVAEEHFKKELLRHEGVAGAVNAGTVVIVHDQCYGHRYSRPKTPKSTLSLIMERPERILASVLGISAAYVRLGERHADGNHPPHPDHNPPERIPFKIRKTSRLVDITSPVVTNVHGTAWMNELKSLCDNAERKLASTGKELARDAPGQASKKELHAGDLYLCSESMNAFQGALGGVLDAVDAVFQGTSMGNGPSRAFVCVRPPGHHCSADFPSGFCWLNNVHVGIEHAMMNYGLTHAAIIDFDLHHGDGSQAITWARNKKVQNMSKNTPNWKKTSIGYFSLHDINSYPCEDGDDDKVQAASLCIDNAHGQSIWNVHLQSWKTPEQFWALYEYKYTVLLEKTRQYLRFHTNRLRTTPNHPSPKAAIFLSAGFDASEWETAGMQRHSVNVPTEFYARFTRDVVRLAGEEGTSVDGRVISVLEGGYSNRALSSGVFSHLSGLCDGQVWTDPKPSKGLAFDMRQRLGRLSMHDEDTPMQSVEEEPTLTTYDPLWWHATQLSELENLVAPPLAVAPKKPRTGPVSHFSSPTQSFAAKVVDPSKLSRSLSGKYPSSPSRAPTPPPPDVDWATAAHALSKLLIPSDRQTHSHKPEDLAEPKVKKEKPAVPAVSSTHVESSGRQLRGRKAAPSYAEPGSDDEKASLRADSTASRRKTIADFPLASVEAPVQARSVSRRMSIASSVSSIGDRSVSRAPSVAASRRSVAPTTAPTTGIPAKKARGTTATTSSRATQRPPVPRIPSNYASKTAVAKGKENDGVDALTSGLKRITLKMPSREEYEAREREKEEKQKAAEATKKATAKTTTKKAPAVRTTTTKAAAKPATAKRGPGRPPKTSKPASPVETKAPTPVPEVPQLQSAATAPLEQPQPVQPESTSHLVQAALPQLAQKVQAVAEAPTVDRRTSGGIMEPPTELEEMTMTPEQLREQLPMPSFVTVTEPLPVISPPPRPDTPPPPPPSSMPEFVNYTRQSFGESHGAPVQTGTPESQAWAAPNWRVPPKTDTTPSSSTTGSRPMSPASKKADLPVFSANGVIPFASSVNAAAAMNPSAMAGFVPGQQGAAAGVKKEESSKDMWEVPDTPAR
ncbi:Arginase/deacetylase [Cucurbitaria berberidis CBS 394.84]|uniref:Arginase/deacetylase n=1 Tax=Cucurbitaria berberidis CBS 394.84 TaxID=1168544 RepID=A0A9P4L6C8_9PLEO|nr:Arginase/deacetylase [Cucurbitaria berberidis CBS 394.84]KAF1843232.1 Arginase/deacetylase [Cucurbitaria berberidis CBS 394.84]